MVCICFVLFFVDKKSSDEGASCRQIGNTGLLTTRILLPTLVGSYGSVSKLCPRFYLAVAIIMARMAKNLYMRLYIYAKRAVFLHKYTVVAPVFQGVFSRNFQQTRTDFGVIGGT